MAIKQISVFVENRQGALHGITEALAAAELLDLEGKESILRRLRQT